MKATTTTTMAREGARRKNCVCDVKVFRVVYCRLSCDSEGFIPGKNHAQLMVEEFAKHTQKPKVSFLYAVQK